MDSDEGVQRVIFQYVSCFIFMRTQTKSSGTETMNWGVLWHRPSKSGAAPCLIGLRFRSFWLDPN